MLINSAAVICFAAHDVDIKEHRFHCYKVVISFKGLLTATLDNDHLPNISGYIVNSNVNHACSSQGVSALVYFIEIESWMGRVIQGVLGNRNYLNISDLLAEPITKQFLSTGSQAQLNGQLPQFANEVLLTIFPAMLHKQSLEPDGRIEQILHYLHTNIHRSLKLRDVAKIIHLSSDRTRHLFGEKMGMPFSQYVLWKRIKLVIYVILKGEMELGEAAHQFGFSDQSHFNRIFKRMFGATPNYILKNTSQLQFVSPNVTSDAT